MTSSILPVYRRSPLAFTHGKGCYLYTNDGNKYLDFMAGTAVNSLGHCHPALVKALTDQAQKLWHVSNIYTIPQAEKLAKKMVAKTFADYAFFTNSGAEAVECAIKTARKYFSDKKEKRFRIITFKGSFHGRTMATISASKKGLEGFEPGLDGFDQVAFNDLGAVKKAIRKDTAGILIEPIQGEGGILPATKEFMKGLRALCNQHGMLLILDEVQCGMSRTGKIFAHELYGVKPDILATAKGIGGGFPLGACLATKEAASGMTVGSHCTTYGGNPLATSVGNAVVDILFKDSTLKQVNEVGAYLKKGLEGLAKKFPKLVLEARGYGLLLGIKLSVDSREFVNALRGHGLLTAAAADNVVRILPPLVLTKKQADEGLKILEKFCKEYEKGIKG